MWGVANELEIGRRKGDSYGSRDAFYLRLRAQKKTSNHWVLAKTTQNGITFMPWDWNLAMSSDIVILCGEGCAASLLSRSLGDWKRSVRSDAAESELAVA